MLNQIAGGWGMGLIAEFRDGLPYGIVEQTNRTNAFSASNRPNILGDPSLSADRPWGAIIERYFDTAAFVQPAVRTFGNAART